MSLPSGYTQLEYIKSTGTQYIDTGFSSTQGWRAKLEYMFNDPSSNPAAVIGDLYGTGGTYWRAFVLTTGGQWQLGYYNTYAIAGSVAAGAKYEIEASTVSGNGYLKVDGTTIIFNDTTTYSPHSAINTYLFAVNYSDSLVLGSGGRLYWCNLYDHNDVLVREFVPAKRRSDNAIGLYDNVEGKFYVNAGTGAFTAGPVVASPSIFVNIDGIWKPINHIYVNINNIWQKST